MNNQVDPGPAKGAGICGIILLVCGLASTIAGFIWVGMAGFGGFGIWSGIGLIITGILGVITWWKRNKGVLIAFLVLTILVLIVAISQAGAAGVWYSLFKIFADPAKCNVIGNKCFCYHSGQGNTYDKSFCGKFEALVNALLVITIFNVIGAIVCLAGSIFACIGTCCASAPSQPGAVVVQQPGVIVTAGNPGYPPQQVAFGYAPQPANVYPPPQYAEKQ